MREALRALVPDPHAPFARWARFIEESAKLVLQRASLRAGDTVFHVMELEGYVHAREHPDPFVHCEPEQKSLGRWYFHRTGEGYRGGTFKGVDVTLGSDEFSAGLLIRALKTSGGERVEGPSCVVDAMLHATGHVTVGSLARACEREDYALSLELNDAPRGEAVFTGPRVGLSLRKELSAERAYFFSRPYRYVVDPRGASKGRLHIALGMHTQGISPEAIAGMMGATRGQVRRWIELYEGGRGRRVAELRGVDDAEGLCALLGACDAAFQRA